MIGHYTSRVDRGKGWMPGASRTFKYSVIMLILFAVRRTEDNFVSVHSQIQLIRAL